MEIIGRLTADAQVSEIKDGRKVVNFNLAVNDYFKTKEGEARNVTEFFRCAYWITPKVAKLLTKGTLVSLYGRAGVDAYLGRDGQPRAALKFYTSSIKILTATSTRRKENDRQSIESAQGKDDTPF